MKNMVVVVAVVVVEVVLSAHHHHDFRDRPSSFLCSLILRSSPRTLKENLIIEALSQAL